jgi:hypothetical protein
MFGSKPPAPAPAPRPAPKAKKEEGEGKGGDLGADLAKSLAVRRRKASSFLGGGRSGKTLLGE